MAIAKFKKNAADRKRYTADYTNWLATDEILSEVTMSASANSDGFTVDGWLINSTSKGVDFFVSGGLPFSEYVVTITATTDKGQIKQDTIDYHVG